MANSTYKGNFQLGQSTFNATYDVSTNKLDISKNGIQNKGTINLNKLRIGLFSISQSPGTTRFVVFVVKKATNDYRLEISTFALESSGNALANAFTPKTHMSSVLKKHK